MILISKVRTSASKKKKPDGVNPNSNDIDYYVRKNGGKIQWFSTGSTCCKINKHDNSLVFDVVVIICGIFYSLGIHILKERGDFYNKIKTQK